MSLIKSISGIRGTIGGKANENLTPLDVVKFVAAFCTFLNQKNTLQHKKIVIGRDARISGKMVLNLAAETAIGLGFDVIDLDLSTTPTVEMAVPLENANGGIIITASHNPKHWNALKLLNEKGEFISEANGKELLEIAEKENFIFADVDKLGKRIAKDYLNIHINLILKYPLVNVQSIEKANLKVLVDGINSSGALYVKKLLEALGVKNIIVLNETMNGDFAHPPEPLDAHLTEISQQVLIQKADLGIVVDPDVDRLCFVNEDGSFFGEEYTLVAIADYVLKYKKGNTVSNLSSTQALKDVTEKHKNCAYFSSKVGEVNVVEKMKNCNAVIGGEGNGGIIVPDFHYGRDALMGIALFLSSLTEENKTPSALRNSFPNYFMHKTKVEIKPNLALNDIFKKIKDYFANARLNEEDGLKLIFETSKEWIHIRSSNTEPIIRIYTESPSQKNSIDLGKQIVQIATTM